MKELFMVNLDIDTVFVNNCRLIKVYDQNIHLHLKSNLLYA
jgi:hypothetical protein